MEKIQQTTDETKPDRWKWMLLWIWSHIFNYFYYHFFKILERTKQKIFCVSRSLLYDFLPILVVVRWMFNDDIVFVTSTTQGLFFVPSLVHFDLHRLIDWPCDRLPIKRYLSTSFKQNCLIIFLHCSLFCNRCFEQVLA